MHFTINATPPILNGLFSLWFFFFLLFNFLEKKFVPPKFSSPSYANVLQSCKRRITVSCHPLYTCIHTCIWMENFRFTSALLCKKTYFREKKTEPAIVYNTLIVYICIHFFFKKCSGKAPTPTPTCEGKFPHAPLPRLCADIGLHPCRKRWTCFWIPHWQCNVFYIFFFFGGGGNFTKLWVSYKVW